MRNAVLSAGVATLGITALASVSIAAPTIDGTRDAGVYPVAPSSVQTIQTGFGDNQSELDNAYATVEGGKLYLFIGGNLESNFNKLDIFLDTDPLNGQNQLLGNNPNVDFDGLNRMGASGAQPGLKFDPGFTADRYISLGRNTTDIFVNYANLPTAGGGTGGFLGQISTPNANQQGSGTLTNAGFPTLDIGYNDANIGGVTGATPGALDVTGTAAGVNTGLELGISLADLGNPVGPIKITVFINGSGHDFLSNQILGPAPVGTGNLGEPRTASFDETAGGLAGQQYFTVAVPEPASLAILGLGAAGLLRRRK